MPKRLEARVSQVREVEARSERTEVEARARAGEASQLN